MKKTVKRILSVTLVLAMLLAQVLVATPLQIEAEAVSAVSSLKNADTDVQNGTTLHCWNWSYESIIQQLPTIAAQGFNAIQVSPIQQAKQPTLGGPGTDWWAYYQPLDFKIDNSGVNALGDKPGFMNLCETAHEYGIYVIVDVVANHMAGEGRNRNPGIPADILYDDSCWHNRGSNIWDYSSRENITQHNLDSVLDLNTGNKKIQNYVLNYLKELVDAGADGFRFDAVKHIETPDDPANIASDFWPTVIYGAEDYATSKGIDLYIYGELLDHPDESGTVPDSAYTKYYSITDNAWGNNVRSAVVAGGNASAFVGGFWKDVPGNQLVLWAESHDTNTNGSSSGVSVENINKTWALVAARADAMSLYLGRMEGFRPPYGLGNAYLKGWHTPEVAAVNKFHTAFVGQGEYIANYGSIAYVLRGTSGAVLVNVGGNGGSISVPAHTMANGTYKDQITGNTFTVSGGKISGNIGSTGIAVVYNVAYCGHSTHNIAGLCSKCGTSVSHSYVSGVCSCGKTQPITSGCTHKAHRFNGVCRGCGANVGHKYSNGLCTVCGVEQPKDPFAYYLNGYIDGSNVSGVDENYRIRDGKITITSKYDAYISVRTYNGIFFQTTPDQQYNQTVTLHNASMGGGSNSQMRVPAGTHTIYLSSQNGNYVLTYAEGGVVDPGPSEEISTEKKTIYFDNSGKGWSSVSLYSWTDAGTACTGAWPGTAMTHLGGNLYSCEVSVSATNVIFNNGSDKTSDLKIPTDGKDMYLSATSSWSTYAQISECDHSYTSKVTTAATCTTTGVKTYTCSKCGSSFKETIAAIGHNMSGTECTVCGYSTVCKHSYTSVVNRQPTCTTVGVKTYTCSKCADSYTETIATIAHSFSGGTCSFCGIMDSNYAPDYYLFGFINGENYACEDDYKNLGQYKFVNGKVTAIFETDSYVAVKTGDNLNWYMTGGWLGMDTNTAMLFNSSINADPNKLYVPGGVEVVFTLVNNGDDTLTLSYTTKSCDHSYTASVTRQPTCTLAGVKTYSCGLCGHSYTEVIPVVSHNYVSGKCTSCGAVDTGYDVNYYLFGFINGDNYACEGDYQNLGKYQFVNGTLVATFEQDSYVGVKTADNATWYMTNGWQGMEATSAVLYSTAVNTDPDKLFVPGGCEVTFTLKANDDGTLTLSYTTAEGKIPGECDHSYTPRVTPATCTSSGYTTYICSKCFDYYVETIPATGHNFVGGQCGNCGEQDPSAITNDFYLFGWINGADYGVNNDWQNLGQYRFVDGKLTATFTDDSYVGVKTGDNANWFMTMGWQGVDATSVVLQNTNQNENPDKLFVPGGTQVTFTLVSNGDGTLTLSYVASQCAHRYSVTASAAATCTSEGFKTYTCSLCSDRYTETVAATGHSFSGGSCTFCGMADAGYQAEYYLFGYINGSNYACDDDWENLGIYKFVDGKVTATFEQDSYVAVKTGDNANWYMTNGWQGMDATSAVLISTSKNENPDKLFVPGGVQVTFELKVNGDGTLTLSYTTATAGGSEAGDGLYLFGYINGANYGCEEDYQTLGTYQFAGGKLTATFLEDSYVAVKTADNANWFMTNGWQDYVSSAILYNTNSLGGNADKLYVPGGTRVTFTLVRNADGSMSLSYASVTCKHTFGSGVVTSRATCGSQGVLTYTCTQCGHFYTETVPAVGHNCSYGKCLVCGADDPNKCCTNHSYAIEYEIMASCTEAGVRSFRAACGATYTVTLPTTGHSYNTRVVTAATCVLPGLKSYTCSCGDTFSQPIEALGHRYENGFCKACGASEESGEVVDQTYYLFGSINGVDYGCGNDWENLGDYKFVGGQLTATFDVDSYVAIKTGDNMNWFMTQEYATSNSATFYNTITGTSEKMFIPGGVRVTFTLTENADGSLTLSYTTTGAGTSVILPNLTLEYPTMSFKDEVKLNIYYSATDLDSVVDMGLIVFSSKVNSYTVYNAESVVSGYNYNTSAGLYSVSTNGIPAKNMGDTIWFAVYAQLSNGTYAYTKLVDYSPRTYAYSLLGSGDAKLDALLVALLNYGTAAQNYFGYNTGSLLNNGLTAAQKGQVSNYNSSMMADIEAPSAAKQGSFRKNGGFEDMYPSVTFGGAFAINYYCVPSNTPVSGVTLYYWREADYNAAGTLTPANATGSLQMTGKGTYKGSVTGISAKDIGDGVYVAFVYSDGTNTYCSGVLPYSIGMYCNTMAGYTNDFTPFAQATAVYGYYAKQYFG